MMKGFLFEQDCTDAVFWISANGEVSETYQPGWIGCKQTDPKNNHKLLMHMISCSNFKEGQVTAEYLNSIG